MLETHTDFIPEGEDSVYLAKKVLSGSKIVQICEIYGHKIDVMQGCKT